MMKLTLAGAALLSALLPATAAFSAPAKCIIVEGRQRYNATGEEVRRCAKLAKRERFKVVSQRKIVEPRCAGKRAGYSFVRQIKGKYHQIVCQGAR